MSVATEIARIQDARNVIRTKLVTLGLATSTADIDDCADAVDGIENRGAVSANVQEGDTYTIPKGYHNGSGTVSGVAGGGNYSLQSKSVTPTKKQQNVTPDSGYYGISDVTVNPIPENYQDVTPVTAGAGDVLANKVIVDATGKSVAGTMPNNGAVSKTLDITTTSYTVPAGYHNGSGKVSIATETKSTTPTKSAQTISATNGKVLSSVTVAAIPSQYKDITSVTAEAEHVLDGKVIVTSAGNVTGTMTNWGALDTELNGSLSSFTIPEGYHNGEGEVTVKTETLTVTPSKDAQYETTTGFFDSVIVNPIPDKYIDTTDATAAAGNILTGKTAYVNGAKVTGDMANNGGVTKVLDTTTTSYTIPAGYHNGNGTVSITVHNASITPDKEFQVAMAGDGCVLGNVTVAPIPDNYIDTTDADAAAGNILTGKTAYVDGVKLTGTMANNGTLSKTIDGMTVSSYTIPAGYHSGSGKVSLTGDIEAALAAI